MSQEHATGRRLGWPEALLWALLVIASIVLMGIGLERAIFFGFRWEPEFIEDARVGGLFILAGSIASLGATIWSALRGDPRWITAFVAAPAVLVGGATLFDPFSLLRHLAAAVAFTFALAGIYAGLPARKSKKAK